jgi:hypothetical protein
MSFVSSTRSTQQKQHCDVGRCLAVDTRGISDRKFPPSGGFQIDMLKTHRVRGDDFYSGETESEPLDRVQCNLSSNPVFRRSRHKCMQLPCHEIHGHKPRFIYIGPGFVPCNCVTTQMTLDARATEMTLTGLGICN